MLGRGTQAGSMVAEVVLIDAVEDDGETELTTLLVADPGRGCPLQK
jgi:hypothetical protein